MQEQRPRRYKLSRQILFPYSGEDSLTPRQSLRVMAAWLLFIPTCMSILTLTFTFLLSYSWRGILIGVVVTFLSTAFIFGLQGWLIVAMNNRSARIRHRQKATEAKNR